MKIVTKAVIQIEFVSEYKNATLEEIETAVGVKIGSMEHQQKIEKGMQGMLEEDGLRVNQVKAISFSACGY